MCPVVSRWQYRLPPPIRRQGEGLTFSRRLLMLFVMSTVFLGVEAAVPRFFESNRMAILLLPEDTETDSIVYRLRAEDSDRNYPLIFQVKGSIGINLIYINAHECTPSNQIYCEADVYLRRHLERGRIYIFNLTVSDQRGDQTEVVARIDATRGRATAASQIFLRYPPSVTVREDVPPKTIIASMVARKGPKATFGEFQVLGMARKLFKVTPSNLVSQDTINGTVSVVAELDYEIANLHTFQICLLQPFTDENVDTRNIACILFSVVIEDVQDEAPIFIHTPPVTRVPSSAVQGDIITKISARDADRGFPRDLRYSILPSSSLYTNFFKINPVTGELSMDDSALKLREKMVSLDPILMTVTAEEVTNTPEHYPALSSSVEIAFVVLDAELLIPKFVHEKYVGEIYEDSVPDSQVFFDSPFLVQGVKGMFALELDGDNGAFSVQPGVVKDASEIKIKVKNSFLLDYEETPQIIFRLTARQVSGLQQLSGSTEITVRLLDTNDNIPKFSKQQYEVEIYENITRGTTIVRVFASDKDSGPFGVVRYTNLYGPLSDRLYIEQTTGVITCSTDNHGFDRESAPEYVLTVEAKDNNGQGTQSNTATAKIILRLKDVNDSPPRFVESIYKGVMDTDRRRLRDPIRIKAIDEDAERPNNEVVYDIMRSSYSDYFQIDRTTGYLDVRQNFAPRFAALNGKESPELARQTRAITDNDTVISLVVRASDLGDPQLSETVDVKIFKQEYGERVVKFIYPRPVFEVKESRAEIENVLNTLTGGVTHITDVRAMSSGYLGIDIDPTRSEVIALVRFGMNSVVDLQQIVSQLNNTEVEQLRTEKLQKEKVIQSMEDQNYSYLVGVVMLCLILAIIFIIILLCCICEGCPLHKDRKKYNMVSDEGSEGVSYVRMDESGRYRRNAEEEPTWFDSMPRFMKDLFITFGYVPPDRNKSRLAWSADERQRHWQMNNQHGIDPGLVENRPRPNNHQGDAVMVEDLDESRFPRPGFPRQDPMMRVESRMSQRSQEPRRVFVLRDPRGNQRVTENLRDGETYLVEASEEANRARNEENRVKNAEDEYQYGRQGNVEVLRVHAGPHDVAYTNDTQRRGRRADVGAEGVKRYEDPGGGIRDRFVDGQSVGQTPRSTRQEKYQEYYNDGRQAEQRYDNKSPPHSDAYIQTDDRDPYKMKSIKEETRSLLDAEGQREKRDKRRSEKSAKQSENTRIKSSISVSSANIPGADHYQHTKSSILRYETIKAKIDEDREEMIRQGKDPTMCEVNHGPGSLSGENRKSGVSSRAPSKLERRSQSQYALSEAGKHKPERRRSSLPDIDTSGEISDPREFRRNSAGAREMYGDQLMRQNQQGHLGGEQVVYVNVNENETLADFERRRQMAQMGYPSNMMTGYSSLPHDTRLLDGRQDYQMHPNGMSYPMLNDLASVNRDGSQSLVYSQGIPVTYVPVANFAPVQAVPQQGIVMQSAVPLQAITQQPIPGQLYVQSPQPVTEPQPTHHQLILPPQNPNLTPQDSEPITSTVNTHQQMTEIVRTSTGPSSLTDPSTEQQNSLALDQRDTTEQTGSSTTIDASYVGRSVRRTEKHLKKEKSKISLVEASNLEDTSINDTLSIGTDIKIQEKTSRNDNSVLNIPQDKRKRSKMLEKKSVFTIAYDGMKTDQLRPDTGTKDP